jgi:hypothetical protein
MCEMATSSLVSPYVVCINTASLHVAVWPLSLYKKMTLLADAVAEKSKTVSEKTKGLSQ